MNKRCLLLSHKLNVSGASVHMTNLAKGLQREGWEVGVVARDLALGTPLGKDHFENNGIRVFECDFPNFSEIKDGLKKIIRDRGKVLYRLYNIKKEFGADILHCHSATLVPFAKAINFVSKGGSVTTLNLGRVSAENQRWVKIATSFYKKALGDQVIAISTEMRDRITGDLGVSPQRTSLVPYAPDSDYFRPPSKKEHKESKAKYEIDNEGLTISLIGILEKHKGHEVLFRALKAIKKKAISFNCLCAGEGSEREKLRNLCRELDIDENVSLLGHQDSREVMWASDLTVLPSTTDSFGLVVVESMLCGVPVIRTPAGGAEDQIIDGENGFVVPFDDSDALADRIEQFVNDPELSSKMGAKAKKYAREKFTIENMASETVDVYNKVM